MMCHMFDRINVLYWSCTIHLREICGLFQDKNIKNSTKLNILETDLGSMQNRNKSNQKSFLLLGMNSKVWASFGILYSF